MPYKSPPERPTVCKMDRASDSQQVFGMDNGWPLKLTTFEEASSTPLLL